MSVRLWSKIFENIFFSSGFSCAETFLWQKQLIPAPFYLKSFLLLLNYLSTIGLFQKKSKQGELRIYFFENPPGIFHFFTLPLEIRDKIKLNHWIFHKIVLDLLGIPIPKTKTPGNSTLFFLSHPWKFYFIFN